MAKTCYSCDFFKAQNITVTFHTILLQLYAIIICWLNNVRDKEVTFGQQNLHSSWIRKSQSHRSVNNYFALHLRFIH